MDEQGANALARRMAADGSVLAGLVGTHIGASRSPSIHQDEADAQGLRLAYRLFDLTSREKRLGDVVAAAELLGFAGLNVTHPFKQSVMPGLAGVTDEATTIGAVNTVVFGPDGPVGHNTDALGYGQALGSALPGADLSHVLQLGAGGAGAATAYALLRRGAEHLTIVDEDPARARALVQRMTLRFPARSIVVGTDVEDAIASATGLVNATPIGMIGHEGAPLALGLLRPELWVSDVVYFPRETELLAAANALGCDTVDGTGMVVLQAAAAFELFTGRPADGPRMLARFEER